jgi:hypothetical protein
MDAIAETSEDARLPALIDRACSRLSSARSSAEVLDAKLTKAANETHADCLRMIVRAEMRIATEIDAGQARGEVATREEHPNGLVRNPDMPPATLETLGVSRQRLSEWRETRDAGEQVVGAARRNEKAH